MLLMVGVRTGPLLIAILPSNSLAPTSSSDTQNDLPMFWFWFEEGDVVDDVEFETLLPPEVGALFFWPFYYYFYLLFTIYMALFTIIITI